MSIRKVIAIVAAISLIIGGYAIWTIIVRAAPAGTADAYIRSLAAGDTEAAQDASCGSAAWATGKPDAAAAELITIRTKVSEMGSGYAEVLAYAELKLADDTYDAGWYRLTLNRQDNEWRVASLSEHQWAFGMSRPASGGDMCDQATILEVYLNALIDGDNEQATRFLCGPARRAHEKAEYNFKQLPVESVSKPQVTPVWQRGNQAVCRAEYDLDGRQIKVLVRFAKLTDGWRIAAVDQL